MSHYTTLLRWPVEQCEQRATSKLASGQQFHAETYTRLGLADYPIFNEAYRTTLNDKIIRKYYFREIGLETLEQFRWYMRSKMFEIMPYYNQMYESELKAAGIDPFVEIDIARTESWDVAGTRDDTTKATHASTTDVATTADSTGKETTADNAKVDGSTSNTGKADTTTSDNGTTGNRNVFQDTPMSLLDNSSAPTVHGLDYATNVTYDDGTSANTGEEHNTTSGSTTNTQTTVTNGTTDTVKKDTGTSKTGVSANDQGTLDSDTTERGTRTGTEKGRNQNMADLLAKWRSTFVNIDAMILDDLAELFMGVY